MSGRRGSGRLPPGPVAKICGLTRLEDVLLARALGAWALGFVFAPSPRRLTPTEARGLIDEAVLAWRSSEPPPTPGWPGAPLAVGVFGDVTATEVARVVEQVGLDAVQLHGQSGPSPVEVREALAGWECPLALAGARQAGVAPGAAAPAPMIIRVVPVTPEAAGPEVLRDAIAAVGGDADLVLFDTRTPERVGGTGTTFPWLLAREAADSVQFLVAGGIDAENVQAALEASSAWGVDVSSGVESSPGSKDAALMGRLLARVQAMGETSGGTTGMDERQEGPRR